MHTIQNTFNRRLALTVSAFLATSGLATSLVASSPAFEPEHHAAADPHHAPAAKPATPKPKAQTTPTHAPASSAPTTATAKPAAKPRPSAEPNAHADDAHAAHADPTPAAPVAANDAEQVLTKLTEGNARWMSGKTTNPHTDSAWRTEIAKGQHPFVTVLTCADSRLPVERIFDQGAGDVFVVRVAGNVAGGSEVGTIEYGVGHLKTPVLVIMGHTKCGAVAAAAANADVHGKLGELVGRVKPSVERAKRLNPGATDEEVVAMAIKENVWQTVYDVLKESSELRESVEAGHVQIVGAICDISTGKVEWMGEHPWQSELLTALNKSTAEPIHAAADEGNE